jgi:hypothetical protein
MDVRWDWAQSDRVEREQVAGQDRLCLRLEEPGPGRTGSPWRGIDACSGEDFQTVEAPIW